MLAWPRPLNLRTLYRLLSGRQGLGAPPHPPGPGRGYCEAPGIRYTGQASRWRGQFREKRANHCSFYSVQASIRKALGVRSSPARAPGRPEHHEDISLDFPYVQRSQALTGTGPCAISPCRGEPEAERIVGEHPSPAYGVLAGKVPAPQNHKTIHGRLATPLACAVLIALPWRTICISFASRCQKCRSGPLGR